MTDCKHYWIVDPPSGPTAQGICKLCGEEKEFPSVSDLDMRSPNQRRGDTLRFWRISTPEHIIERNKDV